MINNKIKQFIEKELPDSCGEGWAVSLQSGDGEMCVLWNYEYPRIQIQLTLKEDKVYSQLFLSVLGLSGQVCSDKLCLPNSHLYTQMCQMETLAAIIPEDSINEHYHLAVEKYVMARRKKRQEERKTRKLEKDIIDKE